MKTIHIMTFWGTVLRVYHQLEGLLELLLKLRPAKQESSVGLGPCNSQYQEHE